MASAPSIGERVEEDEEPRASLLRQHEDHAPVSNIELFFDLVYVFAITQLSHLLSHHLSWMGFLEGLVLFLAVWWVWMFTAWATNFADPERVPVRLLLIALMLASLAMTVAIPTAFAGGGLLFAGSYVAMQLGRTLVMIAAFGRANPGGARNMTRMAIWFAVSAVPWVAGAFADPHARLGWWAAALAIEYAGPALFFFVPGLGRSDLDDWTISGGHMAERAALFIIIALGESIVVTGATVSAAGLASGVAPAFLLAFVGSVAMWWLYFDVGEARGTDLIEGHAEVGRVARAAYTYLHLPIVGGIVISAVADTLLLAEWRGDAAPALVLTQCGGAIVYVAGLGVFKRFSNDRHNFPLSHWVALGLLAALGVVGWFAPVPAVTLFALAVAVLILAAVWEWGSYHGKWL